MQQSPLNASEISEIIKKRIDSIDISTESRNEGTVLSVTDGIIRIHSTVYTVVTQALGR